MFYTRTIHLLAIVLALFMATASMAQAHLSLNATQRVAGLSAPADVLARPDATPAQDKKLHLTFALPAAHKADLEAYIATLHDPNSPNYHRWLTPQQVGQKFGATDGDIQAIVSYAQAQGLTVTHVWPNRLFISADATVAQAERAFGVHIGGYARPAAWLAQGDPPTFFAPDRDPLLPMPIAARVESVFGLSDRIRMHTKTVSPTLLTLLAPGSSLGAPSAPLTTTSTPFSGPLGPADLSRVYNLDPLHAAGFNGDGMTIGIYSPTLVNLADLAAFASAHAISGYTVRIESIDGGATDYNGAVEANLDMDVIVGQANHATIVLYEAPNDGDFDIWNQIVADNLPVLSDSWGSDEKNTPQAYANALDTILAMMDAQGQAHFNASGDSGAFDWETHSQITTIFPGTSTHVTSVGGTSLPSNNNGYWDSETAWSYVPSIGIGSGGGLSTFFSRPSWQAGPGVSNSYSNGMRQVPDVAAVADPYTPGYAIVSYGQWQQVGGTSASTPLWAVTNLLIDQAAGKRLGNLNPALYRIGTTLDASSGLFVYHDITAGNDGYYACTPQWDFVTGWGSADFYKLYADLVLKPNLHPYNPGGSWTSPLMIHANPNDLTEPTAFYDNIIYYFAASVINDGPADANANTQSVQVDAVNHRFTLGPFPAGSYFVNLQAHWAKLAAGTRAIKLITNLDNSVLESNKNDNVYTRIVTVLPHLASLTVVPTSVVGGNSATGTVTLSAAAPAGGYVISLTSGSSYVLMPTSVTVPAGATTASFTITTKPISATKSVSLTTSYHGVTVTTHLTVSTS